MAGMYLSTGDEYLDQVLGGLWLGDNVVWQVESLRDYARFARAFMSLNLWQGKKCVYVRFAPHPPIFMPQKGLDVVSVDPARGFDVFSARVHDIVRQFGKGAFYVFDNLSALVDRWATDELLANFFQLTCPYLRDLDTVAYFALSRGNHANDAVARIADTTQVLVDLYTVGGELHLHLLKAWARYSPHMFIPHRLVDNGCIPVLETASDTEAQARVSEFGLGTTAPWESVYSQLLRLSRGGLVEPQELTALRQELRRMLVGDESAFAILADRFLSLEDLLGIRERLIGSGQIGGKAAGMLLARRILEIENPPIPNAHGATEPLSSLLDGHDSFYVGSDVFFSFLVQNGLFRRRLEIQEMSEYGQADYEALTKAFLQGRFPRDIRERFEQMLVHYGNAPIIVRSSSLFEDSFGHAFAGKYRSEFCVNQGDLKERLDDLERAVKLVYASALSPDALQYRARRGLTDVDEQMAILVQRVVGDYHNSLYYPSMAGVAFSQNVYPWSERIDPDQGLVRLVFGLGTRAVDRVDDYPRMVALSHPDMTPSSSRQTRRYSQRLVDVLDLDSNRLVSWPLTHVIRAAFHPDLHLFTSIVRDGHPYDPVSRVFDADPDDLVLTFGNMLRRTRFADLMKKVLTTLEEAYGQPVDVEFTARVEDGGTVRLNVVQCRPLTLPGMRSEPLPDVDDVSALFFKSKSMAGGGILHGLEYVVYVDPVAYGKIDTEQGKLEIARVVSALNRHPDMVAGGYMLMGPGRWGSSNINLGVHVTYADIDSAQVLVEIAREEAGQRPEVSYGTHFFQDLVEDGIIYLALFPDEEDVMFDEAVLSKAPNILKELEPRFAHWQHVVRVIGLQQAYGRLLHVAADPSLHQALCYLA